MDLTWALTVLRLACGMQSSDFVYIMLVYVA